MKRYPVAEIFDSIQGEGLWAGTPMTFLRLAGCHVGGRAAVCEFADGRKFQCDTDYSARTVMNEVELAGAAKLRRVCITGGEPLDHDLRPLLARLKENGHLIHLETSGSVELPAGVDWVTVSPKIGALDCALIKADEIKLLINEDFSIEYWRNRLKNISTSAIVYVQPINHAESLDFENVRRCLEAVEAMPEWRVSLQLHKVIGVR